MRILIVADDLTGADDTAVQFVNYGAKAVTMLDEQGLLPSDAEVIAITTGTRGDSGEVAYSRVCRLLSAPKYSEFDLVYKKIDSVLRGQIGKEIDAVLDALQFKAALVVPAYPENGRITAGGYHLVNQVPVGDSYVRNDPVTPVTESILPEILSKQSGYPTGHIYMDTVSRGVAAICQELAKLQEAGCRVISADASTELHLEYLAKALLDSDGIVACGSAGLAQGIANEAFGQRFLNSADLSAEVPDPIVGISGSRSAVSLEQTRFAAESCGLAIVEVNPDELCSDANAEVARVKQEAITRLAERQKVLVYVGDFAESVEISKDVLRDTILRSLSIIAQGIMESSDPGTVLLNGGDTAVSVCRGLAASALEIRGELQPGIVLARAIGGKVDGVSIITKSGSFGGADTIAGLFGLGSQDS